MLCEWMKTNYKYMKIHCGKTLEANENADDRNLDGLTGQRETQGILVEEIGGRMPRTEVAGDISFRRPRPTQGCRVVMMMMMMMMMMMVCINRHYQHQNGVGVGDTVRITQRQQTKQIRESSQTPKRCAHYTPQRNGAEIPDARSKWRPMFVVPKYGTCITSPSWRIEFSGGSYILRKFVHPASMGNVHHKVI